MNGLNDRKCGRLLESPENLKKKTKTYTVTSRFMILKLVNNHL